MILAAIWLITAQVVMADRQERMNMAEMRARDVATHFEQHALTIMRYTDTYLQQARRDYQSGGILAVNQYLEQVPRDTKIISHITIVNRQGKPVYISGYTPKPSVSAADRDYFIYQKFNTADDIYFSLPHRGRNTGKLTIRVVRRLEDEGGRFDGVIFAAISVEQFTEFSSAMYLGPNAVATLVGTDKRLRARSSYGAEGPAQDISKSRLWRELAINDIGLYRQLSVVDGTTRSYAYRKLAGYPLIVAIGVSDDDVLNDSWQFRGVAYLVAGLASLITVVIAVFFSRNAVQMSALEREIEHRRRAESDAVRANEVKTTFLATMSHEIRTPINAIMGLFELIQCADVPERQKRQARAGHQSASDLLKQLTNVLDVSRLEAKSLKISVEPHPLREMVAEMRAILEASIMRSSKDLALSVDVEADVPEVVVLDRRRVLQVIVNMIDNAVRFTSAGRVGIRVGKLRRDGGEMLAIAVSDTGVGISEENLDRIFERFGQLDGEMTREAGGTGLGLSISRELADLMGGDLVVESRYGEGSTFTLVLPIEPEGEQ